ncbi:MAG: TldD/PmbA family protein [Candidatus Cloacimonetes bacterium]|nr:TldD/PmbA family protein [Candidatus Cloacimonadota bacterium]
MAISSLEELKKSIHSIIGCYPELKMSIHLRQWQTDFLRFFKSQTNYNISKNTIYADVQLYKDKKNYSFTVNNPSVELIRDRIVEALKVIDKLPPDPDFVDLETNLAKGIEVVKENQIKIISLDMKIEILKSFKAKIEPLGFDLYGTFICNNEINYLMNSNGLDKKWEMSPYYFEIKAVSNKTEVTVLESFGGDTVELDTSFSDINCNEIVQTFKNKVSDFAQKCKLAQNEVIDVDSGDYEVILAPRCIGELMQYYVWSNLKVSSVDREETDLIGKEGLKVFPESFSLYDSPQHRNVVKTEYGSEGHLIGELPIFEKGVFQNFLVNFYYGKKLGYEINGNQGNCLVMQTGEAKLAAMIKSVKKGLYISSFHYMNFINERETSLTGLTRDGTFLIEDGQITKVVNNLRFTEKITDILNNITDIEDKSTVYPMSDNYGSFSISAYSMPHIKVKEFNISSSTKTV